MRDWIHAYKPAAPRRAHLLLVSMIWSAVGVALLFFGTRWAWPSHTAAALLPVALLAGALKSRLVLDRTARRIIDRIENRGDGRCIGGAYSPKTWGVVAVMAFSGRFLRASPLSSATIGLLYTAIGAALLLSTRQLWSAWIQARRQT